MVGGFIISEAGETKGDQKNHLYYTIEWVMRMTPIFWMKGESGGQAGTYYGGQQTIYYTTHSPTTPNVFFLLSISEQKMHIYCCDDDKAIMNYDTGWYTR